MTLEQLKREEVELEAKARSLRTEWVLADNATTIARSKLISSYNLDTAQGPELRALAADHGLTPGHQETDVDLRERLRPLVGTLEMELPDSGGSIRA